MSHSSAPVATTTESSDLPIQPECEDIEDDFELVNVDEFLHETAALTDLKLESSKNSSSESSDSDSGSYISTTMIVATTAAIATAVAGFHIGKTMCKAAAAGAHGAYHHFIESDPTNPETWQPSSYFAPFMSGAASTGVVEVFRRFKGEVEEADLDTTILNAEKWVALADEAASQNRGHLSSDQRNTAVAWIAEARRRLDEYIKSHSGGLHAILGSEAVSGGKSSKAVDASETTSTTEEGVPTAPAATITFGAVSPVQTTCTKTSNQRVTIGAMLKLANKDANARNPSKDQLAQEDVELLNLIQALDNLVRVVPIHVSRITTEQCDDNIKRNPALGSREFISASELRARVLARNLSLPAKDKNKKLMLLASGAGTGKSTTFRQMTEEWARFPLRVITGSEFASMAIPDGSTAFKVFAKRIMALIRECPFKNLVIYGDDFDRALTGAGIFALHKRCRDKLFLFFKDLCDPTISTIFGSETDLAYELAPGRFFPVDWSEIHFGMSCNKPPAELLPETGDKAMLARVTNITPKYADEIDRRVIALEFTLPRLLKSIEEYYDSAGGEGKAQLARIDMDLARRTLLEVTQADIDKYVGAFHRKLGIRGIKDLLDRYTVYVQSRLKRPNVDPNVFALSEGFCLPDIVASIEAYHCGVDADMDAIEQAQVLAQDVSTERLALQELPTHLRASSSAKLDKIVALQNVEKKVQMLQNLRSELYMIRNRVTLPMPADAGRQLDQALGYFRSEGAEVNRFGPIYSVFDDIYWRLRATRRGKERANRLVRVRFTDASAETDSLFRDLAGTLGGLPIRNLHTQSSLFEVLDEYSVFESHPMFDAAVKLCEKGNRSEARLYINDPPNGTVTVLLCQAPGVKVGSSVFHFKSSSRQYLVKAAGLAAAIAYAGTGSWVAWPSGADPMSVQLGDDIEEAVLRRAPKKCNLVDACFRQAFLTDCSALEAFIVLKLTDAIRRQIVVFMSAKKTEGDNDGTSCSNGGDKISDEEAPASTSTSSASEKRAAAKAAYAAREMVAIRQFEHWLVSQLNQREWTLTAGQTVSPRGLTLFLVEPSSMTPSVSTTNTEGADSSCVLDWLIGAPPIEGREKRARAALDAELRALNEDLQTRTSLLDDGGEDDDDDSDSTNNTHKGHFIAPAPAVITLTAAQQKVICSLMAYDKEQALYARTLDGTLSPLPLDRAVGDFISLLRSSVNPFGLETAFPSLGGFMQSWRETYKPEIERLLAAVEQRKQDEAKRERARQEAVDLERIQSNARLNAEHNAASAKAHQLAYQRSFASSRSSARSRSPSPASSRLACYSNSNSSGGAV